MNMQMLIEYAFALLSRIHRYQWGGDDPIAGFDCSGFVQELMKAAGVIPHSTSKMSAQMIYEHFEKTGAHGVFTPGALAFYGESLTKINHIAFCIDQWNMLEMGGGTSATTTDEDAIARNAFCRMRPIKYRKDFLVTVKPQYPGLLR